jgi:ABC-2 type transport system ATP-binding protein
VRRQIGVVFQRPSLDGKLSVLENLTHQGHLYGLSGAPLRARCDELLSRFGLADRHGERVEKLSGGMQRRVEVAKSLLHRPEVLILDEPTTGLDPGARAGLLDYLLELRTADGVTCLLTTHLMDEAEKCDEVAILDRGRLVAAGSPAELKSRIGGDVLTVSAREPGALAQKACERFAVDARLVDGVVHIERDRGHEFVPVLIEAFPGEIDSIRVGRPTLDDVFLHLTGHRLWDDADHGLRGRISNSGDV